MEAGAYLKEKRKMYWHLAAVLGVVAGPKTCMLALFWNVLFDSNLLTYVTSYSLFVLVLYDTEMHNLSVIIFMSCYCPWYCLTLHNLKLNFCCWAFQYFWMIAWQLYWALSVVLGTVRCTGHCPLHWALSVALGTVRCTGHCPLYWALSVVLGTVCCTGHCLLYWALSVVLGTVCCTGHCLLSEVCSVYTVFWKVFSSAHVFT